MDENIAEWKSIGKGADICTNSEAALSHNQGLFYEHFTPLNEPAYVNFKISTVGEAPITEVFKAEHEGYSYILVQHFEDSYNLINDVLLKFKLPEEVSNG